MSLLTGKEWEINFKSIWNFLSKNCEFYSQKIELTGWIWICTFVLECRSTLQRSKQTQMGGGRGVALCHGTAIVEFLFDFHDLFGCKGADSIRQSVNMHIYECPMQNVSHILLPYISLCLQLLCYKF